MSFESSTLKVSSICGQPSSAKLSSSSDPGCSSSEEKTSSTGFLLFSQDLVNLFRLKDLPSDGVGWCPPSVLMSRSACRGRALLEGGLCLPVTDRWSLSAAVSECAALDVGVEGEMRWQLTQKRVRGLWHCWQRMSDLSSSCFPAR